MRPIDRQLLYAAEKGDADDVKKCLKNGGNVNVKDYRWRTPLHYAAESGSEECCRILLDSKASVNAGDILDQTSLHYAAELGSEECCRILLDSKASVNAVDFVKKTPLHYAAKSGSEECCQILLDSKASVNAVDNIALTPLHIACQRYIRTGEMKYYNVICRFIQAGADVSLKDDVNKTPLHYAAKSGSEEYCRILLDSKASVNAVDNDNKTPLHYAATTGSEECCRILLDSKASVNAVDKGNKTPLHYAATTGSEKCCRILLDSKASVNAVDKGNKTPLHYAATTGSEKCCRILLDSKVSVNAVDKDGKTPLHYAAESGSGKLCRILLGSKASVNAVDNNNNTPLHYAAGSGSEECCRILLDSKASVNVVDSGGFTPLHYACDNFNRNGGMKYYKVICVLIHAGADVSLKTSPRNILVSPNKTAFDLLSYFMRRRVQQEYDKITLHSKLMKQGSHPVDVVKVFLCGNPSDGKTSIKETLTKEFSVLSWIKSFFSPSSKRDEDEETDAAADYSKTPGIDVGKQSVRGVGNFVFWDCAGQSEYSVTHGMFLGSRQSLFVLLYDLEKLSKGETPSTKYWLPFIKATRGQNDLPQVILVAQRVAKELLQRSQELFADALQINDELIILDARKEESKGMELLKNVLKRQREEIIGNERLPKLCDKMQTIVKPWREEVVPVISWGQYFERVKEKYPGMDEETLRSVTKYLHMMGEVYLAEFADKEDQVVLNTQWFTSEIIGAAFAGKEFAAQFQTLPNQPYYTLQQLRDFFTKKMDTSQLLALLIHMDLVHETSNQMYLLPGKLPDDSPKIDWDTQRVYDVKGRSIMCVDETDMFNPNVFPCVQKKILDECKAKGSTTDVSRSAVNFSMGSIEVLVQLTKLKRSINIAVMSPNKGSMKACYSSLQHVVELIQVELADRSSGTNLRETYISPYSLRVEKDLENVVTYTKESLLEAEEKGQSVGRKGKPEEISKVLFQGYDRIFLQEFGLECRYEWLPIDTVARCFGRLDRINDWEEDYRAVGKVLGIPKHEVDQLAEDSRRREESATDNILKKWCRDNNKKMTIGMLHRLLRRLSLVDKEDALKAIQEVVDTYGNMNRHGERGESTIEIGVSENLARWRLVLKRNWTVLMADLDPNMLTSRLLYLPENVCRVFESAKPEDVQQRIKNAEELLHFLIRREEEDWPKDLIDGLQETHQRPLAQTLQDEYQKAMTEDQKTTSPWDAPRLAFDDDDA